MKRLARTLLSLLQPLLNYIHCGHLTNARAEGFNSKIQAIKASARGFRNFNNFRIAIFHCGSPPPLLPTVTAEEPVPHGQHMEPECFHGLPIKKVSDVEKEGGFAHGGIELLA